MGNIKVLTALGPLMADETTGAALVKSAEGQNRDEVMLDTYRLTISASSTDLPTLASATFPANLTSILILPEDSTDNIRWARGTASASTSKWPTTGYIMAVDKAGADAIELIDGAGAGSKYVSLTTFGPRN